MRLNRKLGSILAFVATLFLVGYLNERWPGTKSETANFYWYYKIRNATVTPGQCATTDYVNGGGTDLVCNDYKSLRHVPAGYQLYLRDFTGYSAEDSALTNAAENCDMTLEIGSSDDFGIAAADFSYVLEVGPSSSPPLTAAGAQGSTAIGLMLDEGDWFRLKFVDRTTCTSLFGGEFHVVGTLSKKP
jgi:hypothetical protein